MKVSQIVSEHKKGFKAKKYASKPKNTIAPKKPIKTVGPGEEQDLKELGLDPANAEGTVVANDGKTMTVALPDGTQITKPVMGTIGQDAEGQDVFNMMTQPNPGQSPTTAAQTPQQKFAPGTKIPVSTAPPQQTMGEGPETPYFVDNSSGTPMAKTSPRPTAIVASKMWTAITPEIEAKATAQGFHKVMLQHNGKQVTGLEGGDQKLGSKILVAPADFQSMLAPQGSNAGIAKSPMARESAAVKADNELLEKMRMIAGLR